MKRLITYSRMNITRIITLIYVEDLPAYTVTGKDMKSAMYSFDY